MPAKMLYRWGARIYFRPHPREFSRAFSLARKPSLLDLVRKKSAHIFDNIHEHPFVVQIHSGALSRIQFDCYSEQDDLYLEAWVQIIHGLLERLKQHPLAEDPVFVDDLNFIRTHLDAVQEKIHAGVFNPNRKKANFVRAAKTPLIEAYLDHLTRAAHHPQSIAIGFASLFGCYDLYQHVGAYSKASQFRNHHPYYAWLSANYGERFVGTAARIFKLTDRIVDFELTTNLLDHIDPVVQVAHQSYCYEWAFFTSIVENNEVKPTLTRTL